MILNSRVFVRLLRPGGTLFLARDFESLDDHHPIFIMRAGRGFASPGTQNSGRGTHETRE
jgi:hypothetical protein